MVNHRFVVTPWRDAEELFELRRRLYWRAESGLEDRRRSGVDKILAWRVKHGEIPLMLESTADLVNAVLQDENGHLEASSLKLVYGTAIVRFATGVSDTSTELRRSRPSWLPSHLQSTFLDFPTHILETRHSIVHRQFPSLASLKRTAQECLEWLWEWYWSQLDHALRAKEDPTAEAELVGSAEVRVRLQKLLKTYVRDRKIEIKTQKRPASACPASRAAERAIASYLELCGRGRAGQNIVLELLVDEKAILPADKKLGATMSGAFLIWTPFLSQCSISNTSFLQAIMDRMGTVLNGPAQAMMSIEDDPVREGMCEWLLHITTSLDWSDARKGEASVEEMLERCFTTPTFWHLRLAESILKDESLDGRELWMELLRAAKDENMEIDDSEVPETMDEIERHDDTEAKSMDVAKGEGVRLGGNVEKQCGPRKYIGLWRPQPIGMVPKGWEEDE